MYCTVCLVCAVRTIVKSLRGHVHTKCCRTTNRTSGDSALCRPTLDKSHLMSVHLMNFVRHIQPPQRRCKMRDGHTRELSMQRYMFEGLFVYTQMYFMFRKKKYMHKRVEMGDSLLRVAHAHNKTPSRHEWASYILFFGLESNILHS